MNSSSELLSVYANTSIEREIDTRKRRSSEDETRALQCEPKRSRFIYHIRLESESSIDSQDDTESVYSIQGKETDVARDSTDSETLEGSDSENELVALEYDVASLSSGSDDFPDYTSSGTEDLNIQAAAEGAFAAVLLETSREAWETDGETSDGSTVFDALDLVDVRKDFFTCLQCKSHNDNPSFRYCDKCFQKNCWRCKMKKAFIGFPLCGGCFKVRKTLFPPRPKPSRKRKLPNTPASSVTTDEGPSGNAPHKVELDTLESCLNELKKNGGGQSSSQHIPNMNFQDIVVPTEHLNTTSSKKRPNDDTETDSFDEDAAPASKRPKLESSQSQDSSTEAVDETKSQDEDDTEKLLKLGIHLSQQSEDGIKSESDSGVSSQNSSAGGMHLDESCVVCNNAPKNGIFLHGYIGHLCCCYKCAMRVWKSSKRCPICNCKVKQVIKLFTS